MLLKMLVASIVIVSAIMISGCTTMQENTTYNVMVACSNIPNSYEGLRNIGGQWYRIAYFVEPSHGYDDTISRCIYSCQGLSNTGGQVIRNNYGDSIFYCVCGEERICTQ